MRYMLGVIHFAKKPITFKKAEWEEQVNRHSAVQDWLRNSGYFIIHAPGIIEFRKEFLTLLLNLRKVYIDYEASKKVIAETDNETDNEDTSDQKLSSAQLPTK